LPGALFAIVPDPSVTMIEVGTGAGVPMVMSAVPLIVVVPVVTEARMVAVVFTALAVKTLDATPEASLVAEAGAKFPAVALITEKETVTLGTALPPLSRTVAVTVVFPAEAMVALPSVTCIDEAVPPLGEAAVMPVGAATVEALQPARSAANDTSAIRII
jgi:hypothetical protein